MNSINKELISSQARYLQLRIWNDRNRLWTVGSVPQNPVEMLEPGLGFRLLDFKISTEELGEMVDQGNRIRAAGEIDWENRRVTVSPHVSPVERLFTASHELGHAVLHPGLKLHRDRAISGPSSRRDPYEVEADYFAACFLMPERLLRRHFEYCFKADRFELNDRTVRALLNKRAPDAVSFLGVRRNRALAIANATSYDGRNFSSLAKFFSVSPTTMAIRLEELEFV